MMLNREDREDDEDREEKSVDSLRVLCDLRALRGERPVTSGLLPVPLLRARR